MRAGPSSQPAKRVSRSLLHLVVLCGALLALVTALIHTRKLTGPDEPGCRMVWMGPSYARIRSFDKSHTKFASKYTMYLYREQDQDPVPNEADDGFSLLNGIPILFIPGNAGSYRQARSIASETSNLYFREYIHGGDHLNHKTKNFDFFTADFNEDFTAFHGRTILDQAEYLNEALKFILDLYSGNPNPPESVIVIGHSMGGIVARVMVTLPNYLEGSINTILTLASPHSASPLTFDGDLLKIYSAVDKFWIQGFLNNTATGFESFYNDEDKDIAALASKRLSNISLVSITGGSLDTTLPSDYTTLGFLVPPTNGFTVFTTGIPSVWTSIDHLAIVWCAQLRRTIARVLLEISDRRVPERTFDLATRMAVFRKYFLTGFEKYATQDSAALDKTTKLIEVKLDSEAVGTLALGGAKSLKVDQTKLQGPHEDLSISLFQIPHNDVENYTFSLLSSLSVGKLSQDSKCLSVLLCKRSNRDMESNDEEILDFTDSRTQKYAVLSCVDTFNDAKIVPRSSTGSLLDSSFGGEKSPYTALQYDTDILKAYDVIMVKTPLTEFSEQDDFSYSELSNSKSVQYELGKNLFTMFQRGGAEISIPANRPLSINVAIPGAWSSLLAYRLQINSNNEEKDQVLISPYDSIVRQWSDEPFESKWYINVDKEKKLTLTVHGVAPFVPFRRNAKRGLNIEIWSSPALNQSTLDLTISIDFIESFRLILLRYRLALVSACTSIVLLVLLIQFHEFSNTSKFPNFAVGLTKLNSAWNLAVISLILLSLNFATRNEMVQQVLGIYDPVGIHDPNKIHSLLGNSQFKVNPYYLGLEEGSLWYLGIIFYLIGTCLVFITYYVIVGAGVLLVHIMKLVNQLIKFTITRVSSSKKQKSTKKSHPYVKLATPEKEKMESIEESDEEGVEATFEESESSEELQLPLLSTSVNNSLNRRVAATIFLMGMISWYLPYQFIYVIAVLVQMVNVIKVMYQSSNDHNVFNYQISILLLMLWVLPVNVPILIVFIHNLAISWTTPFSSHHNILSILPILIMVQINNNRLRNNFKMKYLRLISWFIYYFIGYCLVYGIRHTFWIHHLVNVFSCLLIISLWDEERS